MKKPMAGWILFAGIVMFVIGTLDFFEGLIAIIRKQYYVVTPTQIIVFDTTTWGWITMIWGILLVCAALALISGAEWARWFGIVVVALSIVEQLGWLGSTQYPLWSLTIVALSIVVLYALTARWSGYREEVTA